MAPKTKGKRHRRSKKKVNGETLPPAYDTQPRQKHLLRLGNLFVDRSIILLLSIGTIPTELLLGRSILPLLNARISSLALRVP